MAVLPEVDTSAQQDPWEKLPEVIKEGLGYSLSRPISALAPPPQVEPTRGTSVPRSEVIHPPPSTTVEQVGAGQTEEMEETLDPIGFLH